MQKHLFVNVLHLEILQPFCECELIENIFKAHRNLKICVQNLCMSAAALMLAAREFTPWTGRRKGNGIKRCWKRTLQEGGRRSGELYRTIRGTAGTVST